MISKGFLVKTIFLVVLLVVITAVIVISMSVGGGAEPSNSRGSRTFFEQFVISGGPIVWFVLLPLSAVMVYLAVEYGFTIRRKVLLPDGVGSEIVREIGQAGLEQLQGQLEGRSDFVSVASVKAIRQGRGDWFRMRNAFAESLQEQAWSYLRKIEWINLIGSVSPMVGLFGTVFGMIKLFNAIVAAGGQPQPAQLADGISIALVTTFWGLSIAIPALAIYGVLRNNIETLAGDAVVESEGVISKFRRVMETKRQVALGKEGKMSAPGRSEEGKSFTKSGRELSK